MNSATLHTWVRSALSSDPQTAEQITAYIQEKCPKETGITLNKVIIALTDFEYHGICHVKSYKDSSTGAEIFLYFTV